MSRIVISEEKAPYVFQEGDPQSICMCGLSATLPFCNGNHKLTKEEEEGKLYHYVDGDRREIEIEQE